MLNFLFKNAKTVLSLLIIVVITSIYATLQIPKERDPNIQIPVFYATTSLSVSATDGVDLLYKPMENAVKNIDGITKTYGATHRSGSFIVMELGINADIKQAHDDIARALNNVTLPEDATKIRLYEITTNDQPVITIDLESTGDEQQLYEWTDNIVEDIESIAGVLEVTISGKRTRQAELVVKPEVLNAYGISPTNISALFSGLDKIITTGQQTDRQHGQFTLKIPTEVRDINQILNITLVRKDGQQLRLRDIATYKQTWREATSLRRLNMQQTVSIQVRKSPDANLRETVDKVKQVFQQKRLEMPDSIQMQIGEDQTKSVDSILSYMQNSVFLTIICIMVVVIALLGVRDGVLVGLSIPLSFMMGISLLYLLEFTLNSVVIFGLTLSLGILIDNAIIIVEYARLKMRQGLSTTDAYTQAVRTMTSPLITSTLTTLMVFLPLIFWPGVMGSFMKNIPIAMILVLSSSLLVALVFTPLLATYFSGLMKLIASLALAAIAYIWVPDVMVKVLANAPADAQQNMGDVQQSIGTVQIAVSILVFIIALLLLRLIKSKPETVDTDNCELDIETVTIDAFCQRANLLIRIYHRVLKIFLFAPKIMMLVLVGGMVGIWVYFAQNNKGMSFFPENSVSTVRINIDVPGSLSLSEKDTYVRMVETKIMQYAIANDNIENVSTRVGDNSNRISNTKKIGTINVELVDWKIRTQTADDIIADLNAILATVKGIDAYIGRAFRGPTMDTDLKINLEGTDLPSIQKSTENVTAYMLGFDTFKKVENSLKRTGIEFLYTPNRAMAEKYGVGITDLSNTINLLTTGVELGEYKPFGANDKLKIFLRYPRKYRTITAVDDLWIKGKQGIIPISYVVDKTVSYPTPEVNLENGKMGATVDAYFVDKRDNVSKVHQQFISDIKNHPDLLVGDTVVKLAGNATEEQQTREFMIVSFALALAAMAIILLLQFNSFYMLFVIMSAIVFSTAGVFLGVIIANKPFSVVMSGLAVMTLAGIVVNDNIVLIDTFKNLCRKEKDMKVAVIKTALLRMGPVMLTSITTALGMLPASLAISMDIFNRQIEFNSPNAMFWQQIAQNILVGVLFALVLTLIFTPCALYARFRKRPYVPK